VITYKTKERKQIDSLIKKSGEKEKKSVTVY
jgi:hypothetical protein